MELDSRLYPIALARILLSGEVRPELRVGNALARPVPVAEPGGKFDCIVANLPFGVRQPEELMWDYPILTSSSESAFIQHILARLRPGGRAVIVGPESLCCHFRGGDVELRRRLLQHLLVESVWSLPTSHSPLSTSLKTSILVIKNSPPQQAVVFFGERLLKPLFETGAKTSLVSVGFGSGKTRLMATLWATLQRPTGLGSSLIGMLGSVGITSLLGPASLAIVPAILALSERRKRRAAGDLENQIEQISIANLSHRNWELYPRKGAELRNSSLLGGTPRAPWPDRWGNWRT